MAETKQKATEATEKQEAPERVFFNDLQFKALKRDYEKAREMLQELIDEYEKLGAGKATKKVFQAITLAEPGLISEAKEEFMKKINADISETTKNPVLSTKLREMVEEPFDKWAEKIKDTRFGIETLFNKNNSPGIIKHLHWHNLELKNSKVVVNEKAIEDECSTHADTESRKKFLELARDTAKQLQELDNMAKEFAGNGYPARIIPGSAHDGYLFNYTANGNIELFPSFLRSIK